MAQYLQLSAENADSAVSLLDLKKVDGDFELKIDFEYEKHLDFDEGHLLQRKLSDLNC